MQKLTLRMERLREIVQRQLKGLSKWQLVLLFGTPMAISLSLVGFIYYKSRKHKIDSATADARHKEPEPPLINQAVDVKTRGNTFFKAGKFTEAIDCYTGAIALCPLDRPDQLALFYQNRAAAYDQLSNPKQVFSDCSRALDLNPKYAKALGRRAKSANRLGNLQIALEDLAFLCTLEKFENEETVKFFEKVLYDLGKQKAKLEMASRKPKLPSKNFMSVFREMFRNDPIFNIDISKLNEGSPFTEACKQFLNGQCENLIDLCNEELSLTESKYLTEALLLRGTAHLYMSAFTDAITDFDSLIEKPDIDTNIKVNAFIKKSNCYSFQSLSPEAMATYAQAVNVDPENADIYFHRGQELMSQDRYEESVENFEKSIELCPDFPQPYVYKCIVEHWIASIDKSSESLENLKVHFGEVINRFPNCIEARIKFGEILLGEGKPEDARLNFEKALELDKNNAMATTYMGVLLLKYKPDSDQIRSYIDKAIEMDDRYPHPYEILGSIEINRDQKQSAVTNFQKAIKLARTEEEIAHLYTLIDATLAQNEVTRRLGINISEAMASTSTMAAQ